jgi:hypothetical protein
MTLHPYPPGHPKRGELPAWIDQQIANHGNSDECLVWPFRLNNHGYGAMTIGGKREYAHRYAFQKHKGPLSPGQRVLHSCDNPPCFNPRHLFPGTQHDNIHDCMVKGRFQHGETGSSHKLTEVQVEEIRRLWAQRGGGSRWAGGLRQQDLAERFGVKRTTIQSITRRKTWRHLN